MTTGGFDVGSIVGHLVLDKDQWRQSVEAVNQDLKRMGADAVRIGKDLTDLGKKWAVAGAAITASLGAAVLSAAKFGDEMDDLRQKTGIAVSVLSSFKLAADKSDLSMGQFAIGMKGLAQSMVESKKAGSVAAGIFDTLGVKAKSADGSMRSMDSVLLDVAEAFSAMPDGADKATIAVNLFGRSGLDMIHFLNMGKDGLQANIDKAKEYGLVIGDVAAAAGDRFKESLDELKGAASGVGMTIGRALMPAAQSLVSGLTEAVSTVREVAASNSDLTKTVAELGASLGVGATVVGTFSMAIGGALKMLGGLATSIGVTKLSLAASMGIWTAAASAIAYYVIKLSEAKAAIDESSAASSRFDKANIDLSNKLYELVKVGAMSVSTYYELWDRFNQNAAAMAVFIKQGGAGVEAQKALVEIGEKHAASLEHQSKNALGMAGSLKQVTEGLSVLKTMMKDVMGFWDENASKLSEGIQMDAFFGQVVEIPIEMDLSNLGTQVEEGNALLKEFVDGGTEAVTAATANAKAAAEAHRALYTQVFADIINGFTSIMDGSKTMGEAFRGIVTNMIADLGKLVIAEILAAKKGILAEQMQAVAHAIAGIFKSLPWFVAIPLAAGAFAVVSKLFSKLLKFDKGGVFTEPTIAEIGHGTEYVLPEKKLIGIVQDALASSSGAAGVGAFSPQLAFAGAGPATPTIHITQNVSFRSLDSRTVSDARDMIFDAVESKISQMRWRSLKRG